MKYYCIKQHDITDCGAACLATICKQNGYKIGITQIREVAGTDKQGTNALLLSGYGRRNSSACAIRKGAPAVLSRCYAANFAHMKALNS